MWLFRKKPDAWIWAQDGELQKADFVSHPSGKQNVLKSRGYTSAYLIAKEDGSVTDFNGGDHYIKYWKPYK